MEGEEVNFYKLKPDEEYIVYQPYLVNDSRSGKKIGRFKKLKKDPYGDIENDYGLTYEVADFYDLKELPGSVLPSGMGSSTENAFPIENTKFYLVKSNEQGYTNNVGGRKKARKARKSRRIRRTRKTRKSRKIRRRVNNSFL